MQQQQQLDAYDTVDAYDTLDANDANDTLDTDPAGTDCYDGRRGVQHDEHGVLAKSSDGRGWYCRHVEQQRHRTARRPC